MAGSSSARLQETDIHPLTAFQNKTKASILFQNNTKPENIKRSQAAQKIGLPDLMVCCNNNTGL